jgi:uncharacterized spore protein YtfJ
MVDEAIPSTPVTPTEPGPDVEASLGLVQDTLDRFLETADVEKAYGEPIANGDRLIIPTAEVVAFMGFGVGSGGGTGEEGSGSGGGGGGGGNAFSRPVAVIVVEPEGVVVTPVIDISKIALTALTAFGFMVATLARMQRRPGG